MTIKLRLVPSVVLYMVLAI